MIASAQPASRHRSHTRRTRRLRKGERGEGGARDVVGRHVFFFFPCLLLLATSEEPIVFSTRPPHPLIWGPPAARLLFWGGVRQPQAATTTPPANRPSPSVSASSVYGWKGEWACRLPRSCGAAYVGEHPRLCCNARSERLRDQIPDYPPACQNEDAHRDCVAPPAARGGM